MKSMATHEIFDSFQSDRIKVDSRMIFFGVRFVLYSVAQVLKRIAKELGLRTRMFKIGTSDLDYARINMHLMKSTLKRIHHLAIYHRIL